MPTDAFIQSMPKAELHIHLEGAIEPATLLRLAERNRVVLPADTVEGLQSWFTFSDFGHFVDIYLIIQSCLRSADDFSLVAYELGADMARQNIRYREATVTPYTHLLQDKGLAAEDIIAGLEDGRRRARRDFGVEMRWVLDIHRNLAMPATAEVTTQLVLDWADRGVVALGLGGNEATAPSAPFAPYFERIKAAGLASAPHAGEIAGPESVWSAVRDLQADRIGHGVRSIEDAHLLAMLRERQIPLEVNPTSNICLGVYRSFEQHPFIHLQHHADAGVRAAGRGLRAGRGRSAAPGSQRRALDLPAGRGKAAHGGGLCPAVRTAQERCAVASAGHPLPHENFHSGRIAASTLFNRCTVSTSSGWPSAVRLTRKV